MQDSLQARSVLFRGLAEPSRLALIGELSQGDRCVSDLASATGLSQPNVSKQLSCLWDCGLVERQRFGREIRYRLVDGLEDLLSAADAVLDVTGERVLACPRFGLANQRRAG